MAKRLNMTPVWRKYDEELSVRVRRVPLSRLFDIAEGTPLEAVFAGEADAAEIRFDAKVALRLALDFFEEAVLEWTMEDEAGKPLAPSREAADLVMTDEPDFMAWLIEAVMVPTVAAAQDEEAEKNG